MRAAACRPRGDGTRWMQSLPFGRIPSISWSTRTRGPHEQLAPVSERQIPTVRPPRRILRLVPVDDDLHAGRDDVLRPAATEQVVRVACLYHPALYFSIRLFHVDMEPRVRIDPFHLHNGSAQRDGPPGVEFRGKRMVRDCGDGRQRQADTRNGSNGVLD